MGSNPVAVTYTTLYSYRDQASYLSQQLVLASKFQCDLTRHCRLLQEVACTFQCWKISALSDRSYNSGAIDVKMDGSVFEEKYSFKMMGLPLSSKLSWTSSFVSISKTASKNFKSLF